MKIEGSDPTEPARSTPAPGQFQRVIQRVAAPVRPPTSPGSGKPMPQGPLPPRGAAPHPPRAGLHPPRAGPFPATSSRPPGTALASGPVLATSRSALTSPENLGLARQGMHREALRLGSVRTEAQTGAQEKTEHRLSELISRELTRELRAEPSPLSLSRAAPPPPEPLRGSAPVEGRPAGGEPQPSVSAAELSPPDNSNPQLRVQATLQLIEKIEFFVQSQRPALRMSLGQPLSATVEVERTGPREVALRIQGSQGPLAQEDLARIRDALGARGLRLSSLSAE